MSDEVFLPFPASTVSTNSNPTLSVRAGTTVPTPAATPAQEEQDPNFTRLELPSNYAPYTFKALYVGPIRGIHQARFAKAAKLKSSRLLVETVGTLLRGASVLDLTPSDFRWLLYWLRKTNYVKTPLLIEAFCSNTAHLEEVAEGKKPMESLRNIGSLNSSIIDEKVLDTERLARVVAENSLLQGMRLGYPTMRDVLLAVEKDDDEFTWLSELAMVLAPIDAEGRPVTLDQRVALVAAMSPEETEALAAYTEAVSDYGASETIRMRCKECGAEILENFQPSAHMFL